MKAEDFQYAVEAFTDAINEIDCILEKGIIDPNGILWNDLHIKRSQYMRSLQMFLDERDDRGLS